MKNSGFTLLELSMVLLIIAFLAGTVVTAKSLIRQAEIRSVMQEYGVYTKAVKEFVDKYQAYPGDLATAETLWGSDSGCPNNTYTASTPTSTATCNGDGNGKVGSCADDLDSVACKTTYINEIWRAWQHLSNAGLIEGRYTGRTGGSSSSTQATPGLNVPASKLRPGGWTFLFYLNVTTSTWLPTDHYGHVLFYGGGKGGHDGKFTTEPVVPVSDAIEMDLKFDDAAPLTGSMRAWKNYWLPQSENGPTSGTSSSYCVNGSSYYIPNGSYSDREYSCSFVFLLGL